MKRLTLLAVTLLLPLVSCSEDTGRGVSVAASVYPFAWVAERVAGDHADVVTLTPPGQEPHDLQLTVRQTADVAGADLAVYAAGFQPGLDEAIASEPPARVIDALELVETPAEVAGDDPHLWLDPRAMVALTEAVVDELSGIDPDHATDYEQRGEELRADLEALDSGAATALGDCARRTVVVSHDAFGYLGARYDLDFAPVNGRTPDAEPSPARLADLQELIRREQVTTVFSERLGSPELAETLADDLDLETSVLDPIEGLSDDTSQDDYLSLMQANIDALVVANDCPEPSS